MKKIKIKKRRRINQCDFRSHAPITLPANIILVPGDGYIDKNKLFDAFPDRVDRNNYLNALIEAME